MPPKGRSSSSHSSSSRSSSSRSSSSRPSSSRSSSSSSSRYSSSSSSGSRSSYSSSRSSGSSSSSRSKGPSRHSTSSHNSTYVGGGLFGRKKVTNPTTSAAAAAGAMAAMGSRSSHSSRPRVNQPRGYIGRKHNPIHTGKHDYIYYDDGWRDDSGTYQAGYYDEEGTRYDALLIKDTETICKCEYCDTIFKIKWDGGALPKCTNCGAPLNAILDDTKAVEMSRSAYNSYNTSYAQAPVKKKRKKWPWVVGILVALSIYGGTLPDEDENVQTVQETNIDDWDEYESYLIPESFYAQPLGRTVSLNEDGQYYDQETDCYFVYNDGMEPPVWQYWYEGISSDFGDFGWMEYSDEENLWRIETDEETWEVLPTKYASWPLWHFEDANAAPGTYFVEPLGRSVEMNDDGDYYDEETDCYFIFNDSLKPAQWQYWYEGISSEYGDYGWMEYDDTSGKWKIETDNGTWSDLPSDVDQTRLWHFADAYKM